MAAKKKVTTKKTTTTKKKVAPKKNATKSNTKKPAFGGYAISFAGRKETVEQVFGKKPITPSKEEIKENPRARSAKLRIAEKI